MTSLDRVLKNYFANKGLSSQSYGFSSSHVCMWQLDHKAGWAPNNWCLRTVVLEKTLESPFNCKEIKPVNPKRINLEYSLEGLMLKWSSNTLATWCKQFTHWKRPWCWERLKAGGEGDNRGRDGWMASLTQRHEFEETPGDSKGQGSLACCSPWGGKELDTTEQQQSYHIYKWTPDIPLRPDAGKMSSFFTFFTLSTSHSSGNSIGSILKISGFFNGGGWGCQ